MKSNRDMTGTSPADLFVIQQETPLVSPDCGGVFPGTLESPLVILLLVMILRSGQHIESLDPADPHFENALHYFDPRERMERMLVP